MAPSSELVIDAHAVKQAGGEVLPGGTGVRIGGWTVTTAHGPITSDAECERLKYGLGTLTMPEQFYGSNSLQLRHEASGVELRFDALGALKGWLADDDSPPIRVEASGVWHASRAADIEREQAKTLEYDWTYTTSYQGDLQLPASGEGTGRGSNGSTAVPAAGGGGVEAGAAPNSSGGGGGGDAAARQWRETGDQMNRALLTSRDPILLFDALPLYESELEDNGVSHVSVKVRLMPRCWLVLLRFYLRVDKVAVRLRETRYFCQFESPEGARTLLRESKRHEGSFAELRAGSAPPEGPAYADGEAAAAALMAAAPVGVTLYRMEKLVL